MNIVDLWMDFRDQNSLSLQKSLLTFYNRQNFHGHCVIMNKSVQYSFRIHFLLIYQLIGLRKLVRLMFFHPNHTYVSRHIFNFDIF